jgi:hypothetical protein
MAIGPKTKNDCAGEDQLQTAAQDSSVTMVYFILTYSWSLLSRGGQISKLTYCLGKNKHMVIGHESKNDCAGVCQQQITALLREVGSRNRWLAISREHRRIRITTVRRLYQATTSEDITC